MLVVDDHRTFADLLVLGLSAEPGLECVGAAYDAVTARAEVARHVPDVVVMDLHLGSSDGIDVARDLLAGRPDLRVVVLTAQADAHAAGRAARAGACAILPKDGELPDLLESIRAAQPGDLFLHPLLAELRQADDVEDPPARVELTPREHDVLQLLAEGRHVKAIARELGISENTCRGYVKTLLAKLQAHSQLEAVVIAGMHGLVDAPRER